MDYKKIYDSIVERAKNRVPEGYVERHHIIPRCMGGSDDKSNLVALTPEEHFLCHALLVKIHPEESGLIFAVNMMTKGHGGKRTKRKLYGWLRRRYSDSSPNLGRILIHNQKTHQNKFLKSGEPIPDGWSKGASPKSKEKMSLSAKSRCETEQGLERMRSLGESHKGKVASAETREKMSLKRAGRKFSEETRERMSTSAKGKTFSDEHKKKLSESRKKYFENKKMALQSSCSQL